MPEQPPPSAAQVQTNLHDLARLLRQAHHLDPAVQQALAELVDELGRALDPGVSSAEITHLAASAAQLAHALHQRHDSGLLTAAKERLESAARRAEAKAPLATGIARRLIDTLANLGI